MNNVYMPEFVKFFSLGDRMINPSFNGSVQRNDFVVRWNRDYLA